MFIKLVSRVHVSQIQTAGLARAVCGRGRCFSGCREAGARARFACARADDVQRNERQTAATEFRSRL